MHKEFGFATTGKEVVDSFADDVKGRTCEPSYCP